ncbi:MAG: FHA domain-containing protein [Planctomycetota bacterium]
MTQIILKDGDSSQTFSITKDITAIGRSSKNDVVIRQGELSRFHCQIRKMPDLPDGQAGGYTIVDLDSRNGIHFNGARVKEKKLEPGDEIQIGKAIVVFEKEMPRAEGQPPSSAVPNLRSGEGQPAPALPAALSPDEFIAKGRRNVVSILARVVIIVAIVFIVLGYGYIKFKERTGRELNIVSKNSSFEETAQIPNLPNGWFSQSDSKALITVVSREFQDGKYSLAVEKSANSNEFCTELYHSSVIKIPSYVRSSPNEIYTFGGWVKSDPFRKSLSGYRISWFDDHHQLIRDDYTEFTGGTKEWKSITAKTRPPSEASYGRFSLLALGADALVYFDNVSVLQSRSESAVLSGRADKAVLDNQLFRLTVLQSGVWSMESSQLAGGIELTGELAFKPSSQESRQGSYNQGRIISADSECIKANAQILSPLSLEMININMECAAGPGMALTYNFPSDLYTYLRDKYFRLLSAMPAGNIRYLKLISDSEVKEVSLHDRTTEKVSGINIGVPNNIISIKYLQPVELTVSREADVLYFSQVFQPLTFASAAESTLAFGLEFDLKTLSQSQTDWERFLRQAEEMERNRDLGEAIEVYRTVLMGMDENSEMAPAVRAKLNTLENGAKELLQDLNDLLSTARLLRDFGLYERVSKQAREISRTYKKTEYGERAKNIIQEIKSETEQARGTEDSGNAGKILSVANGFLKEGQNNLARWLYEEIIQRYGGTPAAKQAKENLEKIPK